MKSGQLKGEDFRRKILTRFANYEISAVEAAKILALSRKRVYQLLKDYKIPRERKLKDIPSELLEKLKNSEITFKELHKITGLAFSTIKIILRRRRIKFKFVRCYRKKSNPKIVLSKKDISRYLTNKETMSTLANKYKCSLPTIGNALRRQNVTKSNKRRGLPCFVIPDKDIPSLVNRKISMSEYAKRNKTTLLTVAKALKRQGLTIKGMEKCRV